MFIITLVYPKRNEIFCLEFDIRQKRHMTKIFGLAKKSVKPDGGGGVGGNKGQHTYYITLSLFSFLPFFLSCSKCFSQVGKGDFSLKETKACVQKQVGRCSV